MKLTILAIVLGLQLPAWAQPDSQGLYFAPTVSLSRPLPRFTSTRDLLPGPLYDENPLWVETYWKAWELAFRHFHEPASGSGFVSQFIDAAFNANIFLWDTAFMTMFCCLADGLVPGISSLDNFYCKQHETGEICREIDRATGRDFDPWVNRLRLPLYSAWGFGTSEKPVPNRYIGRPPPEPPPVLTLDALNNPVAAWAELESFLYTGDTSRLVRVREPLARLYRALQKYLTQGNGLYVTDWASMDNSPRNPFLLGGGQGVDISAQMALFARDLAVIDSIIGNRANVAMWIAEADSIAGRINRLLWDPEKQFYYDRTADDRLVPVKTIGAFWTLVGGVASPQQAAALAAQLRNPATFGRRHPVPSCAADEPAFEPLGGYWRGAVWASTNTMVLRGLERYGYAELAREIALKHLAIVADVFKETGTIWENYAPDAAAAGRHSDGTPVVPDMVGWSGIGPIRYFIEYAIGLKPDAPTNSLVWDIHSRQRSGCDRFRFNGHIVSLAAIPEPTGDGVTITVTTDGRFSLVVKHGRIERMVHVPEGTSVFQVRPG